MAIKNWWWKQLNWDKSLPTVNLVTPLQRIYSHEVPSCPICLYPPVAARITRCGHIFCWPCMLHYLSLSERNWSKCPICYEAVHGGDLKRWGVLRGGGRGEGGRSPGLTTTLTFPSVSPPRQRRGHGDQAVCRW